MANERIDMFEHLANPEDAINLETTYRLWRVMPYFTLMLTNHLIDLLKEKRFWKQALKQDINRIKNLLSPQAEALMYKLIKEESTKTNYSPLNFETALYEKFIGEFLNYYTKIVDIAQVAEIHNLKEQQQAFLDKIVGKAQFMITLSKGDVFTFADSGKYEEFTYNGFRISKGEVICEYICNNSKNGPYLYDCFNIWRPVIKM